MSYLYILFPFVVWVISQTIKFLIRITRQQIPKKLKGILWTYMWAGGMPSTHSAILTSSLFLIWYNFGLSPIFTFCLAVTMLWLYDMVNVHKRQELLNNYFIKDDSETLKKVVTDGYELDLAGHTPKEIIWGVILGLILGSITSYTIGP